MFELIYIRNKENNPGLSQAKLLDAFILDYEEVEKVILYSDFSLV